MPKPGLQIGHQEKNSRSKKLKTQEKTQTQAQNSIFRHILENLYFPCYFFLNKNIVWYWLNKLILTLAAHNKGKVYCIKKNANLKGKTQDKDSKLKEKTQNSRKKLKTQGKNSKLKKKLNFSAYSYVGHEENVANLQAWASPTSSLSCGQT